MRNGVLHMRTDAEIIQIIDEAIKSVWENNIKSDYDANWIMNEDGLKNALYFHLRTYFEGNTNFETLCIYTECTEYGFSSLSYRPDMIIVDKNTDKIVAVFELKYKKLSSC